MSRYTLTLQNRHVRQLEALIWPEDGREGAAYLLCGRAEIDADPWEHGTTRRLLSREVVPVAPGDLLSSSEAHVQVRTGTFARLLRQAREDGLVVGFVHSHSHGVNDFSTQDDLDEPHLVEMAQHRNGTEVEVLSLIMTRAGDLFGRVWRSPTLMERLTMICVIGEQIQLHFANRTQGAAREVFDRQALAFGPALNRDLAALRVGIVGCGATGSAVAALLARLGVNKLLLVDRDAVETSNLSRLHGATVEDAEQQRPKVSVLKKHLQGIGLGARVEVFQGWVGEAACRDGLRSCDIIFGCTDDHDGRLLLNRLSYFYLIPVFDMGIKIAVSDDIPPRILDAAGRVTVLMPGTRCLLCRNVIDPRRAHEEHLGRNSPAECAWQREQQYIEGGGGPSPAVITMTTDVACMAVDELLHRLTGYRAAGGLAHRVRKYHLGEDKRPGVTTGGTCPVCVRSAYWGRGDMEPFLDRTG